MGMERNMGKEAKCRLSPALAFTYTFLPTPCCTPLPSEFPFSLCILRPSFVASLRTILGNPIRYEFQSESLPPLSHRFLEGKTLPSTIRASGLVRERTVEKKRDGMVGSQLVHCQTESNEHGDTRRRDRRLVRIAPFGDRSRGRCWKGDLRSATYRSRSYGRQHQRVSGIRGRSFFCSVHTNAWVLEDAQERMDRNVELT